MITSGVQSQQGFIQVTTGKIFCNGNLGEYDRMRRVKKGRQSGYAVWKKKDWLIEQYLEEGWSIAQIAKMAGVEVTTIVYWMKKHGVETRTISEAKKGSQHSKETKEKIGDGVRKFYKRE